jgi:hypothetical protein
MRRSLLLPLLFWCLATTGLLAEGSAFDLAGPKVDVHVKRGDATLPISETPNLLPGDRLWIHPDLPANQSAHFVLVVAFLRGATNPPPPDWFTRVETWNPEVREEGVFVTVPAGAQQALLFLAPETGGDFNTLRSAVRGLPGSFVRAAQDLQAASWDRMRLQSYLSEVRIVSQSDPATLKTRAEKAARSLGIKIDENCFDRPADQQVSCLSQNSEGLVLDDANAQSLVSQLTNGDTLNLVNALSSTTMAGAGQYSAYIGAIVDTARILSSMHTAHFRYIPALALPTADTLNLRLNIPPSFRNPKSVVVIALPPLGPSRPEPLHPINPGDDFCIQKPGLVLPASGAPLVFATHLAHHLVLHIESHDGEKGLPIDLPLAVDAGRGGMVLDGPAPLLPDGELTGVVQGKWGFDNWKGPQYLIRSSQPGTWTVDPADESAMIVGRDDTLHLAGQNTLCVEKIEGQAKGSPAAKLLWSAPGPGQLKVTVPMKNADPGPVSFSIYQFGLAKPQTISLQAYSNAASLERLTLSAGDPTAVLLGTRLDEVAKAELDGISWKPGDLARVKDLDQLTLGTAGATSKLKPGKHYMASVHLLDGRDLKVPVTVDPPRPQAVLLNKGVQFDTTAQPAAVALGSTNDLPVQGHLVFFLKSTTPPQFSRDDKVEVASADSSFHTTLSLSEGTLMLENSSTVVANVDPLKSFGLSAFGPLRARVVSANGAAGDWFQLGTLVRIPQFSELRCPRSLNRTCILSGTNLFLADSFSATPDFSNPTQVPVDFTGTELEVPHPVSGALYLKLRDDPGTVQTLNMPVTVVPLRTLASGTHREPAAADSAPEVTEPVAADGAQAPPPAASPASGPVTGAPAPANVAPATQTPAAKPVPGSPTPATQQSAPTTSTAPQPAAASNSAPVKPSTADSAAPQSAAPAKAASTKPASATPAQSPAPATNTSDPPAK